MVDSEQQLLLTMKCLSDEQYALPSYEPHLSFSLKSGLIHVQKLSRNKNVLLIKGKTERLLLLLFYGGWQNNV